MGMFQLGNQRQLYADCIGAEELRHRMPQQELGAAVEAHVALIRAFTEQLMASVAEGSLIGMLLTLEEQHRSIAGAALAEGIGAPVSLPTVLRQYYDTCLDMFSTAIRDPDSMASNPPAHQALMILHALHPVLASAAQSLHI